MYVAEGFILSTVCLSTRRENQTKGSIERIMTPFPEHYILTALAEIDRRLSALADS